MTVSRDYTFMAMMKSAESIRCPGQQTYSRGDTGPKMVRQTITKYASRHWIGLSEDIPS